MGCGRWDPATWSSFASGASAKSRKELYKANTIDAYLDPKNIAMRESCYSALNPQATPLIVGLDLTGSMGMLAEILLKQGLGTTFEETLARKPIPDPHLMVLGLGDIRYDRAPLQATQFEADMRITDQIQKIFVEGGGGGNSTESYDLAWWFAATRTKIDCWDKDRRKGFLITVGDEEPPESLPRALMNDKIGAGLQADLSSADALAMALRTYHVLHVVVEEGHHARSAGPDRVAARWAGLLGQNVLRLSDHTKLAEVIVSAIEVIQGGDVGSVAKSWSGSTAMVVAHALKSLPASRGSAPGSGLVKL